MPNARFNLQSSSLSNIVNMTTKEKCICTMLSSANITALNYFSHGGCQLFSNQSIINANFSYSIDLNSSFYFLQFPTRYCSLDNPAPLEGTTVFGNANTSTLTLTKPWGITINSDNSMLVADQSAKRILQVYENTTTGIVLVDDVSIVWSRKAMYDSQLLNLYFMNFENCTIRKTYNRSRNYSTIFGQGCGTNLTQFKSNASFCMDSAGNFYIADNINHRVLYVPSTGTIGSVLAGVTAEDGTDTMHLRNPRDIALNESQGVIYVDDSQNHRIMRYNLGSLNGTVVAGGNGPGTARNQINESSGFCISKKTNAIYIADSKNNRIVRWFVGDSEGTTIIGFCNGTAGVDSFSLNLPLSVALDNEEKYLYVSDYNNNRIQRFRLI